MSRRFVCIRIETYENKTSEGMVRELLNGRFANTAFCIFNPHGTEKLSRAGRTPTDMVVRTGGGDDEVIAELKRIAFQFTPRGKTSDAGLQDFNTFRQALNVASGDQRLLVFVNAKKSVVDRISPTLKEVFADKDIIGKFHLDIAGTKDNAWTNAIRGADSKPGINIIRAGRFGMDGIVMKQLTLRTSAKVLKETLLAANEEFGSTEERKAYSDHVREGKRKQIYFENEIPYGEDRDGDGKPDQQKGNQGGT